MSTTYFLVGRAIVEHEQKGAQRAAYGEQLLERLSIDLATRFGRGFSAENPRLMRSFFKVRARGITADSAVIAQT